jgi:PAS domain S-box-containing protein
VNGIGGSRPATPEALREEVDRLRAIIDTASDGIITIDAQGTVLTANRAVQRLLGYEPDELVGSDVAKIIAGPDGDRHSRYLSRYLADGRATIIGRGREVCARRKDGASVPVHLSISEFETASGPVFTGILRDMTDIRAAQAELRKRSEALERCSSLVVTTSPDGRIDYVNQRFCDVTGYRPYEVIGKHSRLLRSGQSGTDTYRTLWETITAGQAWNGTFHNRRKDGSLFWVAATISPIHDDGGQIAGFLAIEDDITEERAALASAKRVEQRLQAAIEAIDDGFAIYDEHERLAMCNQRYLYTFDAVEPFIKIGMTFEEMVRAALEHGLYTNLPADLEGWVARRTEMFRAADTELELQLPNGMWMRASERLTADGCRVALRTNVTELKRIQSELWKAKNDADQANAAKSEFLSKMSHELRTPLNAILGFSQMLTMNAKEPLTPTQERALKFILSGGEHLLELINEILDLARIESGHTSLLIEPVDLWTMVDDCLALTKSRADSRNLSITFDLTRDLPKVSADAVRLKQVLLNLFSNAVKYNRDGGSIIVRGGVEDATVWFEVADTGLGLDDGQLEQLFTPFERLGQENGSVEGTGIGLAITKQLVELMQGHIGVRSASEQGTAFRVDLPRAAAPLVQEIPA